MAGLHIVAGNRLEILTDVLAENLKIPLISPFSKETIVVQSRGMERWLAMELAKRLGVAANLDFAFPLTHIFDLIRSNVANTPTDDPFAQDVLAWKILSLLQRHHAEPALAPVAAYSKDINSTDILFPLAKRLAGLFDQYLIFRPDIITRWDRGDLISVNKDDLWQAFLWNRLAADPATHRVALRQRFLDLLQGPTALLHLPERLSLFGISSLPPFHLEIFFSLARRLDVHLYLLHPCREYWEDLVPKAKKSRLEAKDPSAGLLDVGHPLLASWGRLGQEFWTVLTNLAPNISPLEFFLNPDGSTILNRLQADILNLHDPEDDGEKTPISPNDRSIQVHSCHSPRREVEALRDVLLDLFQHLPGLAPQDICVMAPNIELYAPYIHSVFGCAEPDVPYLPYAIADQTMANQGETALFMTILDTLSGRFSANSVVSLLDHKAIRTTFNLTETDLETIRIMTAKANIRWSLDADMRLDLGLPPTNENSWEYGLSRLILGFAMVGENQNIFADILPVEGAEGSQGRVLGGLAEFLRRLKLAAHYFQIDVTEPTLESSLVDLPTWSGILHGFINDFFTVDQDREQSLTSLRRTFSRLAELGRRANFVDPVPPNVVRLWLKSALSEHSLGGRFLVGGITFCAMVPMRSIPFRVLCLTGMNHDAFPRDHIAPDFDLMAHSPRPGDRSQRNDDRYLFLEAVLSARDVLYISHVGQNIQDNSSRPPSVLVSELLDCLNAGFRLEGGSAYKKIETHIVTKQRLQAFHPNYFQADPKLFSYSKVNAAGARALMADKNPQPPFKKPLAKRADQPASLELREFLYFWANPARAFLKTRLGADLSLQDLTIPEDETLADLSGLDNYTVLRDMTHRLEQGLPSKLIRDLTRAEGYLPLGHAGDCVLESLLSRAENLLARKLDTAGPALDGMSIQIMLNGLTLTGVIDGIHEKGLASVRFSKNIRAQDYLTAWIKLLVAHCSEEPIKPKQALIVSLDKLSTLVAPPDPMKTLTELLQLFDEGLNRPLPFFPKSSLAYAQELSDNPESREKGLAAAQKAWHQDSDSDYSQGEDVDPFSRRAFASVRNPLDDEFEDIAQKVFNPLISCRTEEK